MSYKKPHPTIPRKPSLCPPTLPSDLYQATYEFVADNSDDKLLSFEENELFQVLEKPGGGWFYAKSMKTNRLGFIPEDYVEKYKTDDVTKV
jgi:SH3 domain